MKKEIKIILPAVYPMDFESNGLILPKDHEVVEDGMVLRFKNYEDLEDLAEQLKCVHHELTNEVNKDKLYRIYDFFEAENDFQQDVLSTIDLYVQTFIRNVREIENIYSEDRIAMLKQAIIIVGESENYYLMEKKLIDLINPFRIYSVPSKLNLWIYATDKNLYFDKIKHAIIDKMKYWRTRLREGER